MAKKRKKKAEISTFMRDPLESIAVHVGKLFDKDPSMLMDVGINLGLAYVGMDTFGWKPESALLGPVSLKLATSGNLAAGAAGAIGLSSIGVARLAPDLLGQIEDWFANLGADGEALVAEHMMREYNLGPESYEIYQTVTALERCPSTGRTDGTHIEVGWGMGLLAKACVFIPFVHPPTPPTNGPIGPIPPNGNGEEPPPPPPPPTDWARFFTQDRMLCTRHLDCDETLCAWDEATLRQFMDSHVCPGSNGGVE